MWLNLAPGRGQVNRHRPPVNALSSRREADSAVRPRTVRCEALLVLDRAMLRDGSPLPDIAGSRFCGAKHLLYASILRRVDLAGGLRNAAAERHRDGLRAEVVSAVGEDEAG